MVQVSRVDAPAPTPPVGPSCGAMDSHRILCTTLLLSYTENNRLFGLLVSQREQFSFKFASILSRTEKLFYMEFLISPFLLLNTYNMICVKKKSE